MTGAGPDVDAKCATSSRGAVEVAGGAIVLGDLVVVDSCHSTWLFDQARRRFRRSVKARAGEPVSTAWRPFDRVIFDPGSEVFYVQLSADDDRRVESWRHVDARCHRCGAARRSARAIAGAGRE